ncbi:MAG: redoxin domain-containing protein [Osedax symbiont Rs1]|nr:MAG: redoxin domain-containing protein [Osedax symbiont Rs1]
MIKIGDKIPACTLKVMGVKGPESFDTLIEFAAKKVVLFAVPGAFTPTCSAAHLPGFVVMFDQLKAAGVDLVACISVNDAFVMSAWGKSANAENIVMLADGNATFSQAIGLDKDASKFHMGTRSKRYAMIIDNGVLSYLAVDEAGLENSSAEQILQQL